mgnify:CR=1 FL=1
MWIHEKRILKKNKEWRWYFPWKGKFNEDEIQSEKSLVTAFYQNKGFKDFYFIDHSVEFNDESINLMSLLLSFNSSSHS